MVPQSRTEFDCGIWSISTTHATLPTGTYISGGESHATGKFLLPQVFGILGCAVATALVGGGGGDVKIITDWAVPVVSPV